MYILDKNKDYYDYFSHIYGEDKLITFDRRGSIICTDNSFVSYETTRQAEHTSGYKDIEQFIILETGYVQYLIKMFDFKFDKNSYNGRDFISCSMKIVNTFTNNENKFGYPISIKSVKIPWNGFNWRNNKNDEPDYSSYTVEEGISIDLPILSGTQITHLINPENIWKDISTYISSLKNDKDIAYVPDIEKVVNHGFNKRESFRNIK